MVVESKRSDTLWSTLLISFVSLFDTLIQLAVEGDLTLFFKSNCRMAYLN